MATTSYEGSWVLGWSVNGESNTALGSTWPQHEADGNVTGVVITMEWTPATPASSSLTLYVLHGDDTWEASGSSPLRLVVDGPDAGGSYRMAATPAGDPAVYVNQAVQFQVTVVTDQPFDPLALGA